MGDAACMSQDKLPFQSMFGQLPGAKAKGERHLAVATVHNNLSTLHIQIHVSGFRARPKWSEAVACSST